MSDNVTQTLAEKHEQALADENDYYRNNPICNDAGDGEDKDED